MKKENDLGRDEIGALVWRTALPSMLAQFVSVLYSIVDRMYIGHIAGVGETALAGVGVCGPVVTMVGSAAVWISWGASPLMGIRMGEGRPEEARRILRTGFCMLLAFSLAMMALVIPLREPMLRFFGASDATYPYADAYFTVYLTGTVFALLAAGLNQMIIAQGFAAQAMRLVVLGAALNIALDPVFIFALKMGVRGAALATVFSQMASAAGAVIFLRDRRAAIRLERGGLSLPAARKILTLGFTPFVMTITECAIQVVFNVCLNRATGGDRDYTAALTVMLSALQLISLPLNGLGNGIQPFVSYNYGKGDEVRLKKGIRFVTVIAFVFCLTIWSLSMAMPQIYAHLFSASESVTEIVGKYCPLFLMGSIMFFVQMTLQNVNVALGQARSALLLAVTRKVVILIPLCFFLTHVLGFRGVYMSEGIADFAAGIITSIVIFTSFPRIFHRRAMQMRGETEK